MRGHAWGQCAHFIPSSQASALAVDRLPAAFRLRTSWSDSGLAFDVRQVARVDAAALVGGSGSSAEMARNLMLMRVRERTRHNRVMRSFRARTADRVLIPFCCFSSSCPPFTTHSAVPFPRTTCLQDNPFDHGGANRLTEMRRAEEAKAQKLSERDAREAAERAKREELTGEALEEYRKQRQKDLDTLVTNVDLSFEDQLAFMDKGRAGKGGASRSSNAQSEAQFKEQFLSGTHIAFTSKDEGKRVVIDTDGTVTCGGSIRSVHWELGTQPAPMAGVIASVEERIRGKIKLQDGSSFQNPPPPRPTRKDDATTLRREAEEQKWTTSRNGRENSTLASRSAAAAWM